MKSDSRKLGLRWTVDQELFPTDGQQAATAGDGFVSRRSYDQGAKLRIPPAELQKSFEIVRMKAACLYFDGPVPPTSLEHRVNFQRFFAPVRHPLTLVISERKTRIFHPQTEPRRLMLWIRRSVGMHSGQERIVQHYKLWWGSTATVCKLRKSFQGRYQIGVLKQRQIVSHCLKGTLVVKLSLQFLQ